MRRLNTRLQGPILIEPVVHRDERGFFQETYRQNVYTELGLPSTEDFVQDNHSRSDKGIIRGMHFQIDTGMAKLIRCPRGAIYDVVVDIRKGSPTYGEWEAFELNEENMHQLYCPVGFAHGFCVVSDLADVVYKCTSYYEPSTERGISFRDPDLAIGWPEGLELAPSQRDAKALILREIEAELTFSV